MSSPGLERGVAADRAMPAEGGTRVAPPPPAHRASAPGVPRTRILLAEDEEHLGAILETFLTARGHEVTRVQDGAAALTKLRERAYDVALLDVVMPEMDGLEVLGALASLAAPPEAIVMTGNGTVDTALTTIRLGAYDYLAKPYRMAEVELLIGRAAEKRALRLSAARARWTDALAPAAFLTDDPALRALLDAAVGAASDDPTRPWFIAGPRGSGHGTLARWLWSSIGGASPSLVVRAMGDRVEDTHALLGLAGAADAGPDAALGALEAAGDGLVVVDGWERLEPSVRGRLAEAVERGGFRRGADADGAWVPLRARICACTTEVDGSEAVLGGAALRVDVPPLDRRPMDIPLLANHLLRDIDRGGLALDDGAMGWLAARRWPGGAAQLRDVLAAAAWHVWSAGWAPGVATSAVLSARELGAAWPLPAGALYQSHERDE